MQRSNLAYNIAGRGVVVDKFDSGYYKLLFTKDLS
jgi:hypothetical protein